MVQITDKSLDVQHIVTSVSNLGAGAINVFIGTVRNHAEGKKVLRLEYEAYEAMAIAEIKKIVEDASLRWKLLGWAIHHRTGVLNPGEASVVIAISTPHRADSFAACQYIIDNLKQKAPIWKKEIFEDGEEWIGSSAASNNLNANDHKVKSPQ